MVSRRNGRSGPSIALFIIYSISWNYFIDALPLTVNEETQGLIHGTKNGVLCDILDLISLAPKDGVGLMTAKQLQGLFCQNVTKSAVNQPLDKSLPSKVDSHGGSFPTTPTYGSSSEINSKTTKLENGNEIIQTANTFSAETMSPSTSVIHSAKSTDSDLTPSATSMQTFNSEITTSRSVLMHTPDLDSGSKLSQPTSPSDPFDFVELITKLDFQPETTLRIPAAEEIGGNVTVAQNKIDVTTISTNLSTSAVLLESDVIDVIGSTTEFFEESEDRSISSLKGVENPTLGVDSEGEVVFDVKTNITFSNSLNSSETDLSLGISNGSETNKVKIHATLHLTDLTFEIPENSVEFSSEADLATKSNAHTGSTTMLDLEVQPTPIPSSHTTIIPEVGRNGAVESTTAMKGLSHILDTTELSLEVQTEHVNDHPTTSEISSSPPLPSENANRGVSSDPALDNKTDKVTTPSIDDDNTSPSIPSGGSFEGDNGRVSEVVHSEKLINEFNTTATIQENASGELNNESATSKNTSNETSKSYELVPDIPLGNITSDDSTSHTTVGEDHQNTSEQDIATTTVTDVQITISEDQSESKPVADSTIEDKAIPETSSVGGIDNHLENTSEQDFSLKASSKSPEIITEASTTQASPNSEGDISVEFTGIPESTKLHSEQTDFTSDLPTTSSSETFELYPKDRSSTLPTSGTTLESDVITTDSTIYNTEMQVSTQIEDVGKITNAPNTNEASITMEIGTARPAQDNSTTAFPVLSAASPAMNDDVRVDEFARTTTIEMIDLGQEFKPVTKSDNDQHKGTTTTSFAIDSTTTESSKGTTLKHEYQTETILVNEVSELPIKIEQNALLGETHVVSTSEPLSETAEEIETSQTFDGNNSDASTHAPLNKITLIDELTTNESQLATKSPVIITDDHTETDSASSEKSSSFEPTTLYPELTVDHSIMTQHVLQTSSPMTDLVTSSKGIDISSTSPALVHNTELIGISSDSELTKEQTTQDSSEKVTTVHYGENANGFIEPNSTKQSEFAESTTLSELYPEQSTGRETKTVTELVSLRTEEPQVYSDHERVTLKADDENDGEKASSPDSGITQRFETSSGRTSNNKDVPTETTLYQLGQTDHTEDYYTTSQIVDSERSTADVSHENTYHTTSKYVKGDQQYQLPSEVTESSFLDMHSSTVIIEDVDEDTDYDTYSERAAAFDTSTAPADERHESSEGVSEEFPHAEFPTTRVVEVSSKDELVTKLATVTVQYTTSIADSIAEETTSKNDLGTLNIDGASKVSKEIPAQSTVNPETNRNSSTKVEFVTDNDEYATTTVSTDTMTLSHNGLDKGTTGGYNKSNGTVTEGMEYAHPTNIPDTNGLQKTPEYDTTTAIDRETTANFETIQENAGEEKAHKETNVPITFAGSNVLSSSTIAPEVTLVSQTLADTQTDHLAQSYTTKSVHLPVVTTIQETHDDGMETVDPITLTPDILPRMEEYTTSPRDLMTTERLLAEVVVNNSLGSSPKDYGTTLPTEHFDSTTIKKTDDFIPSSEGVELTTQAIISESSSHNGSHIPNKTESSNLTETPLHDAELNGPHTTEDSSYDPITTDERTASVTKSDSESQKTHTFSHESYITTATPFVVQTSLGDHELHDPDKAKDQFTENMGSNFITPSSTLPGGTDFKFDSGKEQDATSESLEYSSTSTQIPEIPNDISHANSKIEDHQNSHDLELKANEHDKKTIEPFQSVESDQLVVKSDQNQVTPPQDTIHKQLKSKASIDSDFAVPFISNSSRQSYPDNEISRSELLKDLYNPDVRTNSPVNDTNAASDSYADPYSSHVDSKITNSFNTIIGAAPIISSDLVQHQPLPEGAIQEGKSAGKFNTAADSSIDVSVLDLQDGNGNEYKYPTNESKLDNKTSKPSSMQSRTTQRPNKVVPQDDSNCLSVGNVQVCVNEPIANYLDVEDK